MSSSTGTFKEAVLLVYLPAILVVCSIIAAAACLSEGPFFPVGISGIVVAITVIYAVVVYIKSKQKQQRLEAVLSAEEDRTAALQKRHTSDLAHKDAIIGECKETIDCLNKEVSKLKAELEQTKKAKVEEKPVVKEEKEEEKKAEEPKKETKKSTSKKK